jgi:Tfp pilus assembly protein PilF
MGVRELSKSYQKGLEFYDQGLLLDAIAAFEQAIDCADRDSPEARLATFYIGQAHAALAEDNLSRGARLRAEEHLREAIARNPKFPDLHYQLAEIIAESGAIHEAMVELEAALELNPDYAKALLLLGVLAYEIGEYAAGAGHIAHAVEQEPRYDTPVYRDGLDAHKKDNRRMALEMFKEMLVTNVDDISFHFSMGKKHYRAGEYKQAAEAFEQAISLERNYPDIRNWYGLALMACAEPQRAFDQFQQALDINPNFTAAIINAGIAFEMMKIPDEAALFYKRVLEIDPDNTEARERLDRL